MTTKLWYLKVFGHCHNIHHHNQLEFDSVIRAQMSFLMPQKRRVGGFTSILLRDFLTSIVPIKKNIFTRLDNMFVTVAMLRIVSVSKLQAPNIKLLAKAPAADNHIKFKFWFWQKFKCLLEKFAWQLWPIKVLADGSFSLPSMFCSILHLIYGSKILNLDTFVDTKILNDNTLVDKILFKFCCVLHRLICGPLNAFAATCYALFGSWTLFTEGGTLIFVNIFRIYLIIKVEYVKRPVGPLVFQL